MTESAKKHAWSQTSEVLAMLFNGLFRPATVANAAEFDPTAAVEKPPETLMEAPISALRIFVPSV